MDFKRLKQINEDKLSKQLDNQRYTESQVVALQTQEIIVQSFKSLVDYLDNRVSKTEVVNQLKEIGTPDAMKVVSALQDLHGTLKTHKNTDLSEITKVMRELLDEAKKLPKEKVDITFPEQKDYVAQFTELTDAIKAVEKVVKEQELVAEAPVINVPETNVNVEAPDLKPLQDSIKDVVTAVGNIVIPKTDTTAVEASLKKQSKLLEELLDMPLGGGGGGGRATPYEDSNGIPAFVTLSNGGIPVMIMPLALRKANSGSDLFIAEAQPGSAEADAVWRIQKVDSNGNIYWKDGDANFDNTATDITTGTFS